MTSFFGDSHYFSTPIAQVLQVPQKLSLPLSAMQATPIPHPHRRICAQGWRRTATHTFHGLPFMAQTIIMYTNPSRRMGPYTRISNNSNEKWYWGYPQCFGISVNSTCYLRVTTVIGGQESAPSESIKITK